MRGTGANMILAEKNRFVAPNINGELLNWKSTIKKEECLMKIITLFKEFPSANNLRT
jgi:hypothetical protein